MTELITAVETIQEIETGVKERLAGTFDVLIESANLNSAVVKLATGFFTNFMTNTNEEDIVNILTEMQNDLIPYILKGDDGSN